MKTRQKKAVEDWVKSIRPKEKGYWLWRTLLAKDPDKAVEILEESLHGPHGAKRHG